MIIFITGIGKSNPFNGKQSFDADALEKLAGKPIRSPLDEEAEAELTWMKVKAATTSGQVNVGYVMFNTFQLGLNNCVCLEQMPVRRKTYHVSWTNVRSCLNVVSKFKLQTSKSTIHLSLCQRFLLPQSSQTKFLS